MRRHRWRKGQQQKRAAEEAIKTLADIDAAVDAALMLAATEGRDRKGNRPADVVISAALTISARDNLVTVADGVASAAGKDDSPSTPEDDAEELEREQAERAGAALARRGTVEAVVASPLARTRETARIVARHLGLEVAVEEGLRETDFGAWEGLTFGEVRERYPDDMNRWLADPAAEPTGGGESFAATAVRIAATRDKLAAAYAGRTVLLVSHVTPIKTFVRLALGAPPESLFRMELSAASLSAVAYYADGNASVRLFNDTSHLRP